MRALSIGSLLLATLAFPLSAQTTIDTGLPVLGDARPSPVGWTVGINSPYDRNWVGQTFTVPTLDSTLNSFSFGLLNEPEFVPNNPTGNFQAYSWIQAWNGTTTTGDILFAGGLATAVAPTALGGYTTWYTWDIGGTGLALQPGAQYLAFLGADPTDFSLYAYTDGVIDTWEDRYSGGGTVLLGNSSLPLGGESWYSMSKDVSFKAEFSPGGVVPEPSTILLLGTGLLGLGVIVWRRKEED